MTPSPGLRARAEEGRVLFPRWLMVTIGVVITSVWLANFVVGLFLPDRVDQAINGIFATLVGGVLLAVNSRRGNAASRHPNQDEGDQ